MKCCNSQISNNIRCSKDRTNQTPHYLRALATVLVPFLPRSFSYRFNFAFSAASFLIA